jgi:hypothetical protein
VFGHVVPTADLPRIALVGSSVSDA